MGKKVFAIGAVAVLGIVCIAFVNGCKPERLTPERAQAAREVEQKLAETEKEREPMEDQPEAHKTEDGPLLERVPSPEEYDGGKGPEHATLTAPETFKVQFVCSNGNFVVECHREWAPIGVDRFYNLVVQGFFNEARFFRVVPGFVVQFGINGDPALSAKWREATIQDEPVKKGNKKATLTFAKSQMPNSRTTQLFINLADNSPLDAQGFSAFAEVIQGMDVVEGITAKYGEQPNQMMVQQQGNEYLKTNFPDMDYIKEAYIGK
ncbi:MAG: peptidylprolyl isomerase [Candidatus Hydrogenedentes bacterium]|nr:peptidylprolyl isomerase [Candidatus Hydrogenedentota bacterium]